MKASAYVIYDSNFKFCFGYCRIEQACVSICYMNANTSGFILFIYFRIKIYNVGNEVNSEPVDLLYQAEYVYKIHCLHSLSLKLHLPAYVISTPVILHILTMQ